MDIKNCRKRLINSEKVLLVTSMLVNHIIIKVFALHECITNVLLFFHQFHIYKSILKSKYQ